MRFEIPLTGTLVAELPLSVRLALENMLLNFFCTEFGIAMNCFGVLFQPSDCVKTIGVFHFMNLVHRNLCVPWVEVASKDRSLRTHAAYS